MHTKTLRIATVVASVTSVGLPATASAQLEEIVVTAQRRETNLQQTPISIQAFTSEDLEMANLDTGSDLSAMVPNLVANPQGGGVGAPQFYIRGLPGVGIYIDGVWQSSWGFLESNFAEVERVEVLRGPQGTLFGRNTNGGAINITTRRPADEFGVRMSLDVGEFNRRYATATVDLPLSDTLKTKWMVSSRKHDGFIRSVTVPRSLGNQDDQLLRADILWEPTDNFSLRFTANDEDKRGTEPRIVRITNENNAQYIRYNVLAGNPEYLARALAVDPNFPESPFKSLFPSCCFSPETHMPGYPGGELGKWQTKSDTPPNGVRRDVQYYTLTAQWRISDNLSFEAIMSDWELNRQQDVDFDGSEFTFTTDTNRSLDENDTLELHLTGNNFNGRINWLAGFYSLEEHTKSRTYRWTMLELPREPGSELTLRADAQAYLQAWRATVGLPPTPAGIFGHIDELNLIEGDQEALFGEVTVGLTDKLDMTLGVRITDDSGRTLAMTPTDGFRPERPGEEPQGDIYAGTLREVRPRPDFGRNTTNKFALQYQLTDDIMLYGSYSEGFTETGVSYINIPTLQPDGTCPAISTPIPLDREEISNREIGIRSDLLDRRLRVNATYFDASWDGMRVVALPIDPCTGAPAPNPYPTSEGLGDASGLELEVIYAPAVADRWQFNVGLGMIDTSYRNAGFFDPASGSGTSPSAPFAYAPDNSAALGVQYTQPLSNGGRLMVVGNYGWSDKYVRDAAHQRIPVDENGNYIMEPAYGILNLRLLYEPANANWSVSLWGTNLTDEQYVNGGFDARQVWGYDFALVGPSREVGASLSIRF
ncbi:MAG TPA: TonB-dependent receptor [Gammaproteobacteria bacterium]